MSSIRVPTTVFRVTIGTGDRVCLHETAFSDVTFDTNVSLVSVDGQRSRVDDFGQTCARKTQVDQISWSKTGFKSKIGCLSVRTCVKLATVTQPSSNSQSRTAYMARQQNHHPAASYLCDEEFPPLNGKGEHNFHAPIDSTVAAPGVDPSPASATPKRQPRAFLAAKTHKKHKKQKKEKDKLVEVVQVPVSSGPADTIQDISPPEPVLSLPDAQKQKQEKKKDKKEKNQKDELVAVVQVPVSSGPADTIQEISPPEPVLGHQDARKKQKKNKKEKNQKGELVAVVQVPVSSGPADMI
jgi:hypothetical protein